MYYLLDENKKPIKQDTMNLDWINDLTEEMRRTARDEINGVVISTVFLGIDHSFGQEKPVLWETMCFSENGDFNDYQERYTSHEDALEGHKKAVEAVTKNEPLMGRKILKIKI